MDEQKEMLDHLRRLHKNLAKENAMLMDIFYAGEHITSNSKSTRDRNAWNKFDKAMCRFGEYFMKTMTL